MYHKHIIFFIIYLLFVGNAYCQDEQLVIPPTPQAQQFAKYIDYPVNYSTGLPDVEVPIYTIRSGDLVIPLSLTYHFTGLKPSEESGVIGLGWNLNYGGNISRTIRGYPDECYLDQDIVHENEITGSSNNLVDDVDYSYLHYTTTGSRDVQYDVFNYTTINSSGHFILERDETGSSHAPVVLPYRPINISFTKTGGGLSQKIECFDLIDEIGVKYRYGKSKINNSEEIEQYQSVSSPTSAWEDGTIGWMLTDIEAPNSSHSISFEYEYVKKSSNSNWIEKNSKNFTGTFNDYIGGGQIHNDAGLTSESRSSSYYSTKRLKLIKFNGNEIRFTYKSNYYPNSLLEKIEVYDSVTAEVIKTIVLKQSKFHNSSRMNWDKLDAVEYYGQSINHLEKKYQFEYNTTIGFPVINESITNETFSIDHWGYYNGKGNTTLLPPLSNLPVPAAALQYLTGTANREPDALYAQAGILKQIRYPAGGTTNFYYKGNKIGSDYVGGVCLDKVVTQTDGTSITKTFEYNNPIGVDFVRDIYYFNQSMSVQADGSVFANYTTSSNLATNIYLNNMPVVYGSVTEYLGTISVNNGKIVHTYNTELLSKYLSPDQIDYNSQSYPLTLISGWNWTPKNYYQYYFKYGNTYEKEISYYNASNSIVKNIKNFYSNDIINSYNGLLVKRQVNNYSGLNHYKVCYFTYSTYCIQQVGQKLDSAIVTTYAMDNNPELVSRINYVYNDYLQLKSKTTKNSDGKLVENKFKYPADINTGVYASMKNSNMLNYPIETTELVNTRVVGSKLTTYKSNSGGYVPDKVYTLETASPLSSFTAFNGSTKDSHYNSSKPEIKFEYYDSKGNPTQITNREGITTSYLWDNTGQYPMAKVEGATYSAVSSLNGKICSYNSSTLYNSLKSKVPGAMISTYSYKPLIGLAQQTDPKGTSTYYDYDAFGRLKNIRDDDEFITSRNYYHYYNETTSDGEEDPNDPSEPDLYFSVSPSFLRFMAYGGTQSFTIESNTDWTVTQLPIWVTLSKTSGSGNATIVVTCSSYSSSMRSDVIVIQSTSEGTLLSTKALAILQNY
nr:BACON domain-containing protein [uncultured Draconibacterium sp.]